MELLNMLIENYDLSDLINQILIAILLLILIAQTNIKVRFQWHNSRFWGV